MHAGLVPQSIDVHSPADAAVFQFMREGNRQVGEDRVLHLQDIHELDVFDVAFEDLRRDLGDCARGQIQVHHLDRIAPPPV